MILHILTKYYKDGHHSKCVSIHPLYTFQSPTIHVSSSSDVSSIYHIDTMAIHNPHIVNSNLEKHTLTV